MELLFFFSKNLESFESACSESEALALAGLQADKNKLSATNTFKLISPKSLEFKCLIVRKLDD